MDPRPSLVSFVIVLLLFAAGCRVPATIELPEPTPAPPPIFVEDPEPAAALPPAAVSLDLASFESFVGLRFGDTRADAIARFGEPVYSEPGEELDTLYFFMTQDTIIGDGPPGAGDDFLFVLTIDNLDERVFSIQANLGDYAGHGIEDPRLAFLGADLSQVEASFGPPDRSDAGFNTYGYVDPERGIELEVEFVCYEHDGYVCSEIWVSWFEP